MAYVVQRPCSDLMGMLWRLINCRFVSCKWTLTGDNDKSLSHKGWFVFSQPLHMLVALSGFVVAAIGTAPGGLGMDTLIASILL